MIILLPCIINRSIVHMKSKNGGKSMIGKHNNEKGCFSYSNICKELLWLWIVCCGATNIQQNKYCVTLFSLLFLLLLQYSPFGIQHHRIFSTQAIWHGMAALNAQIYCYIRVCTDNFSISKCTYDKWIWYPCNKTLFRIENLPLKKIAKIL